MRGHTPPNGGSLSEPAVSGLDSSSQVEPARGFAAGTGLSGGILSCVESVGSGWSVMCQSAGKRGGKRGGEVFGRPAGSSTGGGYGGSVVPRGRARAPVTRGVPQLFWG